jgi:pimeloyl-ACP methyl ester carboxylesterase
VAGDPSYQPVILLHGGGQTRHSWSATLSELADAGYHVINFDARGHGESAWSDERDYSLEAFLGDLRCIVSTLHLPPVLIGASMGGITALLFASAVQPPAAALILVDIVPRIEPGGASRILDFMRSHPGGFSTLEEAAQAVADYNPLKHVKGPPHGLMKNLRLRNGRLHWHWDPHILTLGAEAPRIAERLYRAASSVKIPTLLVHGHRSDIVSTDGVRELKARLPQLEVLDVAEAGHMVVDDENEVFARGLLSFLRQQAPSAG